MVRTFMIAAVTTAAVSAPGLAQEPKFKAVSVKTPDGLTISAQNWGNPNGPEIRTCLKLWRGRVVRHAPTKRKRTVILELAVRFPEPK